jgi:hypothetical protein
MPVVSERRTIAGTLLAKNARLAQPAGLLARFEGRFQNDPLGVHGPLVMLSEYGVNILDQLGWVHVLRRAGSTKHECIKPQQYCRQPIRPEHPLLHDRLSPHPWTIAGEPRPMTLQPLLTAAAACL